MKTVRFLMMVLTCSLAAAALQTIAQAQTVSLTTAGTAYTQNFDTLSNTAASTTNTLAIPGWALTETGGGARDNEQYGVDTGSSTTGDTYSYGAAANTDRALGGLRSGTLIPVFGAAFTNNTGSAVSSLNVSFTGEQWRLGTAVRTDQLNFEYSLDATDLTTGTWTGVAALNFITPDTATVGVKNGNAAADRTALAAAIAGLNIPNGATFWIRWTDTDASGADDGLAVDDFSITPIGTTAASSSIAGRVLANGKGLANVRVEITGTGGVTRTVMTNPFGNFTIPEVESGATYVVNVSAKRYTFASQVISVTDNVSDLTFTAQ